MDKEIMPQAEAMTAPESHGASAPKVILKQTTRALKKHKKPPTFTDGELLAWKGVWFRLVGRGVDNNGKLTFLLHPQTIEVVDVDAQSNNLASHRVQPKQDEGPKELKRDSIISVSEKEEGNYS